MSAMLEYQDLKSPIHKLTGATKLIALIFWALASMITYDTRILGGMFIFSRIKNSAAIIMPLVLSSLERIESISSAMELRAFGNSKKRTWYSGKPFAKRDYIAISIVICVFIAALVATKINGGRFFNPFL